MKSGSAAIALVSGGLFAAAATAVSVTGQKPAPVTVAEHVAPILYANCVTCHRTGEVAPFPLITYDHAAAHALQIAKVTAARIMPPWHAEHGYGDFADERRL